MKHLNLLLILTCSLFVLDVPGVRSQSQPTQATQQGVELRYEDGILYTSVGNQQYFIDQAAPLQASTANAILDQSRQHVYYVQNTGCGFENEGTTLFRSDIYGRFTLPILSRCEMLTPMKLLALQGRSYLLIKEENGGTALGTAFWLLNLEPLKFVLHAEGELTPKGAQSFSYGVYNRAERLRPLGTVNLQTFLRKAKPLKLLPGLPTRALTVAGNTKLVMTDPYCSPLEGEEARIIREPRSEVLIAGGCPDGAYQVYFQDTLGRVAKRDLKPLPEDTIGPYVIERGPLADSYFHQRDKALLQSYQRLKAHWVKKQISQTVYVANLEKLREAELSLFESAKNHQFKDQTEYNYWHRGRLKFPSEIEVELKMFSQ